jgi:hypothetical protein
MGIPGIDLPPLPPTSLEVPNSTLPDPDSDTGLPDTGWWRIEPVPLTPDLRPALRAEIADPAWMICRQAQFLEFQGDDGGSPIQAKFEGECSQLTRYAPGAPDANAANRAVPYSAEDMPLEPLVEREPVWVRHPRLVAEAGQHLVRMLDAAGIGALRGNVLAAFPLMIPRALDAGTDTAGDEWRQLAAGRAIDAKALADAIVATRGSAPALTALPAGLTVDATSLAKTIDVLNRWVRWFEDAVLEPGGGDAWNPHRLEYGFSTATSGSNGEMVLGTQQYADGTLDWYSVVGADASLGTPAGAVQSISLPPSLPMPLPFPGKPADRFWEFEDATVNFGLVDAGPTDLGRLALIEFLLTYENDWFQVPVPLPVGAVFRVTKLTVLDTFGVETIVGPSADAGTRPWSVFNVSGGTVPDGAFLLPPTVVDTLESAPLEEVVLFRDEMANLVWGVERRVQGLSGDSYERTVDEVQRTAQQQVAGAPVDAQLVYRLATTVPDNWIPFVPVAANGSDAGSNPVVQLERRVMIRTQTDGTRFDVQPRGVLFRSDPTQSPAAEAPLRIEEEEVPREGAVVTRAFQFARWFDGRSLLWAGKRKGVGRGEGSSGLRFDVTERR